jgi:hypothetical protein
MMPGKKRPDGTVEDDSPAQQKPEQAAPPPAPPEPPPQDNKATKSDDIKPPEPPKKNASNEAIIGAAAVKSSGFESGMSDVAASTMNFGDSVGKQFRDKTGITKITDAAESLITKPINAGLTAVSAVVAAPKTILSATYTGTKNVLYAVTHPLTTMSKIADTTRAALGYDKLPERPTPVSKQSDRNLVAEHLEEREEQRQRERKQMGLGSLGSGI